MPVGARVDGLGGYVPLDRHDRARTTGQAAIAALYAKTHPDTLIIVTADHAHTSQILDGGEQTATDHAPGLIRKLRTSDGADLVVSYGTNLPGRSQEHTGATVRVAAQGPQAAGVVGTIDQTDLFHVMARAIGAK